MAHHTTRLTFRPGPRNSRRSERRPVRSLDDRLVPRYLAHRPPLIRPHPASLQPATPASKPRASTRRAGLPGRRRSAAGPDGAGRIVRKTARRAGITKAVTPHTLRHAFITAALDAGVPLRDVQEAASHADPLTTMRYDRARGSLDRHATYIVAAYVAGAAR
jgi:integrase